MISKQSIARWIKEMLSLANIDINIFKAHSTRSASTSKAERLGLRVEEIMKQGNWSTKSTFENFYRKPIISKERNFQSLILGESELSINNNKPL